MSEAFQLERRKEYFALLIGPPTYVSKDLYSCRMSALRALIATLWYQQSMFSAQALFFYIQSSHT